MEMMETRRSSAEHAASFERPVTPMKPLRWLLLAGGLTLVVVAWEYLLNALLNPEVVWNPTGMAAHAALDVALVLPAMVLALFGGLWLARRIGLDRSAGDGLLGTVAAVALVFLLLAVPLATVRDLPHEWMGTTWGFSLAEVQTTIVRTDLTVQEATQLCSFSSVRNPSLARQGYGAGAEMLLLVERLATGFSDALVQLAALLPLLLVVLLLVDRRQRSGWNAAPAFALLRWGTRPLRLAGVAAVGLAALFCFGGGGEPGVGVAEAQGGAGLAYNACTDGGPVKEYEISAIDVTITLNRFGDHVRGGFMYTLDANIPNVRAFEAALEADRTAPESLTAARVSHGLRKDPIQPMVVRANLGDCLRVHFTNRLTDGQPASLHILGLPHTASNAGSAVGTNPDTFAQPGQTVTYEIPIPRDPNAERAYYFHDHGAGRRRQNLGLFGAIAVEPAGATYLDVETGQPLDTVTGSNWEAIIVDPNLAGAPDGKSFREFVIFYHEIGDEAFTDIRDRDGELMPLIDDIAGVYRPAARALNYRSEPFRRRLEIEKTGKALGYASYPFGDPSTPIPRSYVGEGVKTRLLHGGSEIFHVHHLHGGGDRWRRNPNTDAANDFWKGLTKVPDPNLTSIHLDSQSIGPGTSYNLEHECGAGGCQQGVGDFLFHCHIGHHYISGMWSFWRVFGTTQTAQTNLSGHPLAVVPDLFQNPSNPVIAPSEPEAGVSAGDLLGLTVDGGKTLSAGPTTASTKNLGEWIAEQLPPPGVRLDKFDSTVWDWTTTGSGASLQIWGEPESTVPFEGYVSATPGQRPEVLFNPKNGRYTWPLFHPQRGQRPPFTARHTGAPWLGEEMKDGRLDGLCARNGITPAVDVGQSFNRFYPVSAITLPIQISPGKTDDDGQIFVLNEEEMAIRSGAKAAEPLTIRSNVGDCVEILLTNKIPDGPLNKDFSKVNIHSHFVQFDTQASDGVITGMSYEQSVRPIESEGRFLTAAVGPGDTVLPVNHTDRLRPGIWLGIGLGEGTCGVTAQGQPKRCTEIRKITALTPTSITLEAPLENAHGAAEAVGVEFVRYHWYSDVDFGTVFFHTHVEFKDWDHGLFGTHIVEPKGASYHHPETGADVRAGALVDIRVDPAAGGNPVAYDVAGSFREFVLYLHDNNPALGPTSSENGGGTINLRAEPWSERPGDPAWRFSSVTHGDPLTPLVRAYVGDPVVIRGMGLVERVGGVRFTGHRFQQERYTAASDTRDTTFLGISERFDVSLEGGAGGPGGFPGDYLYYSTVGRDFQAGAWGLMRVHDTAQGDLQPLPGLGAPAAGAGFPRLTETGLAPPSLPEEKAQNIGICPIGSPQRLYQVQISDTHIIYNDLKAPDKFGVSYHTPGALGEIDPIDGKGSARTPLVLRANVGDCVRVRLGNNRTSRVGLNVGELLFDPQASYGVAVGYNYDSSIAPGTTRTLEYYADAELGLVLGINLAEAETVERGAFLGIVIEPEGATWHRPGSANPLPGGGTGIQADIVAGGERYREFVALFNDQDRQIGQNSMPYPKNVTRSAGISYSREPLELRNFLAQPADVFRSALWGDPRHVVSVPAGTPLIYRVGHAGGQQVHVPTLEGHRWYLEPGMAGSEQVYNDVLAPGQTLNLLFVGGAGGDIGAPGDYLFLDRRQPFMEYGLWNILRVTDGPAQGVDIVRVREATTRPALSQRRGVTDKVGEILTASGIVGVLPAGDTVASVIVHAGGAEGGRCTGPVLDRVAVDPGSGRWSLEAVVETAPSRICVQSPGGGASEQAVR